MIDLSSAVNSDGTPVVPVTANVPHANMRRADQLASWDATFVRARADGKPPKHEMGSEHIPYYLAGILLMYSVFDPLGEYEDFDTLPRFLDRMEVGGYRIGRSRGGTPWASIFVRNVQYCAVKYVPGWMRYPELVLLSLVGRANLKTVSEWLLHVFSHPLNEDMFNRRGIAVRLVDPTGGTEWNIRVSYMSFDHAFHLSDFLHFFKRDFSSNYDFEVPRPVNDGRAIHAFSVPPFMVSTVPAP